jgi:hypothetical protein
MIKKSWKIVQKLSTKKNPKGWCEPEPFQMKSEYTDHSSTASDKYRIEQTWA